ncbi:MAG: hypothetical protein OXS29_05275 [bacterium]|nr:hypothetical protein [bacterium]MDE0289099.1 hypothetical protein [bacterium]MDE0440400.1 hypothetical protein [bacterium]
MGQFGPAFTDARGFGGSRTAVCTRLGFCRGRRTVFVFVLDAVGTRFRGAAGVRGALIAALVLASLLMAVDAIRL